VKVSEYLRRIGAKAGLLHIEEKEQAIDTGVFETRVVSLPTLLQQQEETLAAPPAELTLDFQQIFQAVRLPAFPHGWNVQRLAELMNSENCRNLPPQERQKVLQETLGKEKIPPEDIVKDALARDKALDSYQEFLARKLKQREEAIQARINELQKEIEESHKKIDRLKTSARTISSGYEDWVERKTRFEEDLVAVVSLIADAHGISVTPKEKK